SARPLRTRRRRRRPRLAALPPCHLAGRAQSLHHLDPALDHLVAGRFQQRLSAHRRRAARPHAHAGDARHQVRLPDRRRVDRRRHRDHRAAAGGAGGGLPGEPARAARAMNARAATEEARRVLFAAALMVWTLLPIYHMVMLSVTPVKDAVGTHLWPPQPTLDNYRTVFAQGHFFLHDFWQQLANSTLVALATCTLVLAIASLASYAISRLKLA